MLGVGVGFDTKGAERINVVAPGSAESLEVRRQNNICGCAVRDDSGRQISSIMIDLATLASRMLDHTPC